MNAAAELKFLPKYSRKLALPTMYIYGDNHLITVPYKLLFKLSSFHKRNGKEKRNFNCII